MVLYAGEICIVRNSSVSSLCHASGTLSPGGGTLSLDCDNEQTFTCSVSVAAVWSIDSTSGELAIVTDTGLAADRASPRITTSDTSGNVNTSRITINGFSEADNGTVISCIDRDDSSVQGTVLLSISESSNTPTLVQHRYQCIVCDMTVALLLILLYTLVLADTTGCYPLSHKVNV